MMKYWKSILLTITPLLIVGALYCARDPILTQAFHWYLQKFSIKYLDGELQAKDFYIKDGALVLENPRIEKRDGSTPIRVGARAEKMILEYAIQPMEFRIDIQVAVTQPTIYIDEESPSLEHFFNKVIRHSNLPRVNTSISLNQGEALLQGPEASLRHVRFELDATSSSNGDYQGHLAVNIDEKGTFRNAFNINAEKKESEPLTAVCTFDNMDCVALFRLVKFLWPTVDDWSVYTGILDGNLSVVFPEESPPYCEGEALVRGLTVANTQMHLSSDVGEARLILEKNLDGTSWSDMPSTVGRFEMVQSASVVFYRFGRPFWEMRGLKGFVSLDPNEGADLSFTGKCTHRQRSFDMNLKGEGRFFKEEQGSIDVVLGLASEGPDDTSIRFIARQLGSFWDCGEVVLKNVSQDEFTLIQEPLARYFPDLGKVHVHSGSLDASIIAYLQNYHVTDVKIDKIAARHLEFDVAPLDIAVSIGEASGELTVSCIPQDILETLNADFKIRDGQLKIATGNNEYWRFRDINTQIGVRKGNFQRSVLKGEFAGLWGSVEVDWNDPRQVMKMCFNGNGESLQNLVPLNMRKGIKHVFSKDHVALKGVVCRDQNSLNIVGEVTISQNQSEKMDRIDFGFELEKSTDPFWDYWAGHPPTSSYWEDIGLEAIRVMMPELASPILILQSDWSKRKSGIAGLVIRNGWFQGNGLALEKYIAPYCFEGTSLSLSGIGDFEGAYDHKTLAVKYNAYKVCLENDTFRLCVNSLSDHENDTVKQASHYFDLEKGTHFGFIPLRKASYLEKVNNLLFTESYADVTLDPGKIYLHDVETFLNEMYLAGEINIDYTEFSEGVMDIDIKSHTLDGNVSQLCQLLPHSEKKVLFQSFATDGRLHYRGDGLLMKFHIVPGECYFDTRIQGALSEGQCTFPTGDMEVEGLSFNFDYRHQDDFFEVRDIEGICRVGKSYQQDEFLIAGEHIRFDQISNSVGEFDVWFGNKSRDLIRFVGKTRGIENEPSMTCLTLNKELTHFGNFHPGYFSLTLKKWFELEDLHLKFDFKLDRFLHDLGPLISSGLFMSADAVKSMKDIKNVDGAFTADFCYDSQEAKFLFDVKGQNVSLGDKMFKTFLFQGKNKDGVWAVDQLLLDQYSIAADIAKDETIWNVNFLGLRCGESILMGLEGRYDAEAYVFDARVNLLEIDIAKLEEWPSLANYVKSFCPNGILRGTGQAKIEKENDKSKWKAEALLTTSLHSWGLKGLQYKDTENISCHFNSKRGITLRRIDTALMSRKSKHVQGLVTLEKLDYDFASGVLDFEDLNFNIPADSLPWLTENLQQTFPDTVTPGIANALQNSKKQGNLEGSLSWDLSPKGKNVRLQLKEGMYHFSDNDHTFNNFVMTCDPYEMNVITQYHYNQDVFWMHGIAQAPTFNKGVLILTEKHPEQINSSKETDPLIAEWELDPLYGLQFLKAKGCLEGLQVDLQADTSRPMSSEQLNLIGVIKANMREARHLLPKEIGDKVKSWEFGKGYAFSGNWTYYKENAADHNKGFHLLGKVGGKDLEFKGYIWDSLVANIDYSPKRVLIDGLELSDKAGSIQIGKANFQQDTVKNWFVSVPEIQVKNLRPSFLREPGNLTLGKPKPLNIKKIEVLGVHGALGDRSSFVGEGKLYFSNPTRKAIHNTLLAIPVEILARIGLDLGVLQPVTGTIHYHIADGKIHLRRLKDVYSDSKLSKFYIPSSAKESWVDFDGNMNLQIRMKQNNLLFKIAELLTFNIRGNIHKPTFTLQKQERKEKMYLRDLRQ